MFMNTSNAKGIIKTVAVAAFALSLLTPYRLKAAEAGQLSKKELKSLVKTANTPAEHLRVAGYYRSEAASLRALADEHKAMMAQNPMSGASRVWAARGMNHCEYLEKEYTQEAEKADSKAAQHERMAAEAAPRASLTFAAMGK